MAKLLGFVLAYATSMLVWLPLTRRFYQTLNGDWGDRHQTLFSGSRTSQASAAGISRRRDVIALTATYVIMISLAALLTWLKVISGSSVFGVVLGVNTVTLLRRST